MEDPTGLVATDLNTDGVLDLAVAIQLFHESKGLAVLLGNGDGTFSLRSHPSMGVLRPISLPVTLTATGIWTSPWPKIMRTRCGWFLARATAPFNRYSLH